jgi:excinuclease ABC subunit A
MRDAPFAPEAGETTEFLEVNGARVHNLRNVDVRIPRDRLVVITGLSGSGKSSLAFDTIYAEGQRRYMETFAAYARQFMGSLERPDVDNITGLSPVISIEQKSTGRSPRSTVGTITEIYDLFRLLYARSGEAYSFNTGERMVRFTDQEIQEAIVKDFDGARIAILAPLIKGRKGHYRELFEQLRRQGYQKVRVNGTFHDLTSKLSLDRYKVHDIDLVVDRIQMKSDQRKRLSESVEVAMRYTKGSLSVVDVDSDRQRFFSRHLMCPSTGIAYDDPAPNLFSFNSPYGACPGCNGLGMVSEVDEAKVIPDPGKSIAKGGIIPLGEERNTWIFRQLEAIADKYHFTLKTPIRDIPPQAMQIILHGADEVFKVRDADSSSRSYSLSFEGILSFIEKQQEDGASKTVQKWAGAYSVQRTCPTCGGARLKKEAMWFRMGGKGIAEVAAMDLNDLGTWLDALPAQMDERQLFIGREVIKEIKVRLQFLLDVGLEYLSLDRPSRSLSGGEAQRIRLATQIGSQLVGVLYILDEPSIGLHQRDNTRLIEALRKLRDTGNSVIVVEHDRDMMLAADHVIDLGPGAGRHGGRIVAQGSPKELLTQESLTSAYLNGGRSIPPKTTFRKGNGKAVLLEGATGNNLKDVSVRFPLGKFICVTGVSGSGKSTLINETLYPILSQHLYRSDARPLPYRKVSGLNEVDKVIAIDQSAIGRTPRSNPATYTGVFADIRNLFSLIPESQIRGYKPGRFSFNVKGGRCEECQGAGVRTIEMNFLPDVHVRCSACNGLRYNRETLEVRYRGRSISDVLDMTIDSAVEFFTNIPTILQKIKTLQEVGLGYITLGQSAVTLSGGEAQRIKLATELSRRDTGSTFYILDEPTTGLHFEDVRILLDVLNRLVDRGNTVLVIEHNLDIVRTADLVIDMGPEGGRNGGRIIAQADPISLAKESDTYTAQHLRSELKLYGII